MQVSTWWCCFILNCSWCCSCIFCCCFVFKCLLWLLPLCIRLLQQMMMELQLVWLLHYKFCFGFCFVVLNICIFCCFSFWWYTRLLFIACVMADIVWWLLIVAEYCGICKTACYKVAAVVASMLSSGFTIYFYTNTFIPVCRFMQFTVIGNDC